MGWLISTIGQMLLFLGIALLQVFRKVVCPNGIFLADDQGVLQNVLQFPDITRVIVV